MIPIVLITGFLGSGKTTFINWLLEKHPDKKISVILNEFGDIKLESQFVKFHTENIVELANGCMCCVAKSDIPRVVSYILEKSPQTEYILIEASGLSDPDPVREALQTPPVNISTYLESTICIIDTLHFEQARSEHPIISAQIADADVVVLSKIIEAGQEKTQRIQQHIQNMAPDVQVILFDDKLHPELFLLNTIPKTIRQTDEHHHIHEEAETFTYQSTKAFQFKEVQEYISQLPSNILRVKGILHCVTKDNKPFVVRIQRVGTHFSFELISPYEKVLSETVILFIGKNIQSDEIRQNLDSFSV